MTEVVVAVPAAQRAAFAAVLPRGVAVVDGGATRTASVRAGLAAVARGRPTPSSCTTPPGR